MAWLGIVSCPPNARLVSIAVQCRLFPRRSISARASGSRSARQHVSRSFSQPERSAVRTICSLSYASAPFDLQALIALSAAFSLARFVSFRFASTKFSCTRVVRIQSVKYTVRYSYIVTVRFLIKNIRTF